ncbi:GtrA family protein [Candidatus Saccharibacteria bacterium]|nr:GtrA family protein [Candidatus Saccharibacteria bacterium]MBI3337875.1 GtrA family protein [Candidatus Saccharibacteria bacterium]
MFKFKKKQRIEITRITEYIVSGGAYFWSGYLMFFFIDKILDGSFFWAKSLSTLFGWTANYLLQRFWVFKNPGLKKHETEVTNRYIIITLMDFVLDYLIVYGLKVAGLTPYIGQFVSSGFFTVWNYLWYKYWVFPEKFKSYKKAKISIAKVVAHRPHGHSAYRI